MADLSEPNGRDADLVALLLGGDERAFHDLVRSHQGAMQALARRLCRSSDIADEIVQDTWIAVLTGLPRFEGRSSLRTWVFSILTNKAITRSKRERRVTPFSALARRAAAPDDVVDPERVLQQHGWSAPPLSWESAPNRRLDDAEIRRLVLAAAADLPPRQHLVFSLRDVHLWSSQEVCELLQITGVHQRALFHVARTTPRKALGDYIRGDLA